MERLYILYYIPAQSASGKATQLALIRQWALLKRHKENKERIFKVCRVLETAAMQFFTSLRMHGRIMVEF